MKVKVKIIEPPYTDVSTESLQAICRNHAHDKLLVRISVKQLYEIMDVLVERDEASGRPQKTAEEAWIEFEKHYMPKETKP